MSQKAKGQKGAERRRRKNNRKSRKRKRRRRKRTRKKEPLTKLGRGLCKNQHSPKDYRNKIAPRSIRTKSSRKVSPLTNNMVDPISQTPCPKPQTKMEAHLLAIQGNRWHMTSPTHVRPSPHPHLSKSEGETTTMMNPSTSNTDRAGGKAGKVNKTHQGQDRPVTQTCPTGTPDHSHQSKRRWTRQR